MRSLASGRREPVGARRAGPEVAGPGEATMKPNGEDEAPPAGGPWEECFEAAVQLALRAGQVSPRAPPGRRGPASAAPEGRAGRPSKLGRVRADSRGRRKPSGAGGASS